MLPTLQEAATIGLVIERVTSVLDKLNVAYELIVVDDSSSDGTPELVRALCDLVPQLRLVERKGERGLAGAILDGWSVSSSSVLGVIDADLQHPPELLPLLWETMGNGADLAVASRYAQGATVGRWRWLRRLTSSFAVLLCRPLQSGHRLVRDPMSGYFMVRREVVSALPTMQRSGFKLLLEILVRGRLSDVQEVPFCFGTRQGGLSKAGPSVLRDYMTLLLRLYGNRLRGESRVTGGWAHEFQAARPELLPQAQPVPVPKD